VDRMEKENHQNGNDSQPIEIVQPHRLLSGTVNLWRGGYSLNSGSPNRLAGRFQSREWTAGTF
jgi:hypothetical protein